MIDDTFSLTLAEIAATYAGFGTIAVVFGRVSGRKDLHLEARVTHGLVASSAFLVIFCVLPHAVDRIGFGDPWRTSAMIASALGALLGALAVSDILAFARADPDLAARERGYFVIPVALLAIGLIAFLLGAIGFSRLAAQEAYALGLVTYFLNSTHMLIRAVRAFLFSS